jgi:sulfotransferase
LIEFKANPNEAAKLRVLGGILQSFYADTKAPIVFDKSRGWNAYLEMAEAVLKRPAKVLVPVRDVAEVLASFEKLNRNASIGSRTAPERADYFKAQTVAGRCEHWASASAPVGLAYNRIKDALQRGYGDRMHFVEYDILASNPEETMKGIYEFLNLPYFPHNFNHVEQVIFEDDAAYGFKGLHSIRSKVAPQEHNAESVLGADVAARYRGIEFWRR